MSCYNTHIASLSQQEIQASVGWDYTTLSET